MEYSVIIANGGRSQNLQQSNLKRLNFRNFEISSIKKED